MLDLLQHYLPFSPDSDTAHSIELDYAAEIMTAKGVPQARAARVLRKARAHMPPGVSSDFIYVKMFKRIPQIDLEMLFPNTKVAFRPFDKLKLMVTAGGGTVAGPEPPPNCFSSPIPSRSPSASPA